MRFKDHTELSAGLLRSGVANLLLVKALQGGWKVRNHFLVIKLIEQQRVLEANTLWIEFG